MDLVRKLINEIHDAASLATFIAKENDAEYRLDAHGSHLDSVHDGYCYDCQVWL